MARKAKAKVRFVATDKVLKRIEYLAARNLNQTEIAAALGIARTTWYLHKADDARIDEAMFKGKADGTLTASNVIYDAMLEGDKDAAKFYLKNASGWAEVTRQSVAVTNASQPTQDVPEALKTVDPIEASRIYQDLITRT